MIAILREHDLNMNCLRPGQFVKHCLSGQKMQEMQQTTSLYWLHADVEKKQRPHIDKELTCRQERKGVTPVKMSHLSPMKENHQALLIWCARSK